MHILSSAPTVSKQGTLKRTTYLSLRRSLRRNCAGGVRSILGITFNETRSFRV